MNPEKTPSEKTKNNYKVLKDTSAAWKLLTSTNGPTILAILKTHLFDNKEERVLKASVLAERIKGDLLAAREGSKDNPKSPFSYIDDWVDKQYLTREFQKGDDEEKLWLSAATIDAIRFVEGLANPRSNVTESRLAILIQATSKLARDADHNSARRLEFLEEERELIDNEIKALKEGLKPVISNLEALERVREIISLGTGLTEDFSRVQEYYKGIHQDLREKILKSDEPLAVVLDEVFENLKHLENTEAGRTFQAFFTLLSNPSQQHTFSFAMKAIRESDFYKDLTEQEKYFLNQFIFLLYDQSCAVHKVTERFSESLHSLLKSREFQERRKITTLLKETFKLAGDLSSKISMTKPLDFFLELSSSNLFSASQMELMDYYPENKLLPVKMAETDTNNISNVLMAMKIDEIDFRSLKSNILKILERFKEASIGDILFSYPAEEGLGSVVGLLHLAQRHGKRKDSLTENISWIGLDGVYRTAYMDKWYFTRECINELSTG